MKVLHTYCLNYNIGDYALGIGVKNLLRNYLKIDFIANTNLQGRVFDEYYINEVINTKYDLLVIGGGGIIHGAHWPNGWFWLIKQELIKTIKIPFIVYGIGNNYFFSEAPMPEKTLPHLLETYKNAAFFSVRNDGSYERILEQTGLNAIEVPDPGFHVSLNTTYRNIIDSPYVIIQLANDKTEYRFGNSNNKDQFISSMRKIVIWLSKHYHVLFAPHVFDDIALSKIIMEGVSNCSIWDFGYLAFDHSEIAVGYYKYAEFVLAMRGHGQILPIGFCVPVVSLANHPKNDGLMKKIGLEQYIVNILDINFEKVLIDKIKLIEFERISLVKKLEDINKTLFAQTNKAFELIKEIVVF